MKTELQLDLSDENPEVFSTEAWEDEDLDRTADLAEDPALRAALEAALEKTKMGAMKDDLLKEDHELVKARLENNRYAAAMQALGALIGEPSDKRPTAEEAQRIAEKIEAHIHELRATRQVDAPPEGAHAPLSYVTSEGILRLHKNITSALGIPNGGDVALIEDAETQRCEIVSAERFLNELEKSKSAR